MVLLLLYVRPSNKCVRILKRNLDLTYLVLFLCIRKCFPVYYKHKDKLYDESNRRRKHNPCLTLLFDRELPWVPSTSINSLLDCKTSDKLFYTVNTLLLASFGQLMILNLDINLSWKTIDLQGKGISSPVNGSLSLVISSSVAPGGILLCSSSQVQVLLYPNLP